MQRYYNAGWRLFLPLLVLLGAVLVVAPFKSRSKGPWLAVTHAQAGGKAQNTRFPASRHAVLVELFTSEGCSSCPPADALLGTLRHDLAKAGLDVVPLGFHVDYWNSLGWNDRFSSAAFSRRQEEYARAFQLDGPYTPQMVVDGTTEFEGNERQRANSVIAESAAHAAGASIEASFTAPDKLTLKVASATNGAAVLLAITEDNLSTKIGAGENNGRELRHAAVVRELRQLGVIQNGSFATTVPLALEKEWKRSDLRAVIFVQQGVAGPVLGTASVPLQVKAR